MGRSSPRPNIAVIHEVGEHQGQPFIVMQYLEGTTLGDTVRQRRLPVNEWLQIARSIADGLAHAHKQGIVHRDLKPDNVMITGEGQVKLLDFGLAKLTEVEPEPLPQDAPTDTRLETISRELTRTGSVVGTVAYMSPEQARGEQVDHRSDLFSFGVMLYEMASGKRPFSGRSTVESLHATIADEPPPLSQVTGDVPAEAERVVRKALEKEPGRRYQDAADLATDLRNLKRDLDAGRASVTSGVTAAVAPRRRSPWRLGAAVTGVALVVAAAAYLHFGRQPVATATPAEDSSIAVVGFENLSDPDDADHLGRMLMGLITTDLAESGGLSVISVPKVLAAVRQVSGGSTGGFDAATYSSARMATIPSAASATTISCMAATGTMCSKLWMPDSAGWTGEAVPTPSCSWAARTRPSI